LHEGGFGIRRADDGALRFVRGDGRYIPRCGYRLEDMRDDDRSGTAPSMEVDSIQAFERERTSMEADSIQAFEREHTSVEVRERAGPYGIRPPLYARNSRRAILQTPPCFT
jgi:hypothetical protein